jgi:outer membrane receptor protein involved in Fe transport
MNPPRLPSHPPRRTRALLFGLALATTTAASGQATAPAAAAATEAEVTVLPEFQTSATRQQDAYISSEATTGTRTGSKIMEVPYSVQVLTAQFIDDFQLYETDQQLAFVSGYNPGNLDSGVVGGNRLRGFQPVIMRDGFSRAGPGEFGISQEVEVIKGPQSTLYGTATPGGMVNYVSKRPRTKPGYKARVTFGDLYTFQNHSVEATGPLAGDRLFYLLNVGYNYNENDQDFAFHRVYHCGLTLTYKLSARTSVTGYVEQQKRSQNLAPGILELRVDTRPVAGNDPFRRTGGIVVGPYLSLRHVNAWGPDSYLDRNYDTLNAQLEHRFGAAWSARVKFSAYWKHFEGQRWTTVQYDPVTLRTWGREPYRDNQETVVGAGQSELLGRFEHAAIKHTLLLAVDWTDSFIEDHSYQLPAAEVATLRTGQRYLDPLNQDWTPFDYARLTRLTGNLRRYTDNLGGFLNHRVFFFDGRLITTAGLRYERVRNDNRDTVTSPNPAKGAHGALTYTAGANYYVLGEALALFASHGTSFDPTVSIDRGTGNTRLNEEGKSTEAGLKGQFFNQRIGVTLSAFETSKFNIGVRNPDFVLNNPRDGTPEFLGNGEQRARGGELNVSARITDSLTILANGGYTATEITKNPDSPQLVGTELDRAPKLNGSAVVRYGFRSGRLKGLRVGASVTYAGRALLNRASATRARLESPPVQLYNAFLSYDWRTGRFSHTTSLNGMNVFDKFYLTSNDRVGRERELRISHSVTY